MKVTGAPDLTAVEDIEMELEQRRAHGQQVKLMEENLKAECQKFAEQYVLDGGVLFLVEIQDERLHE